MDQSCDGDSDCALSNCSKRFTDDTRVCVATCDDGAMNGDETGIDCGGTSCAACDGLSACTSDAECDRFFFNDAYKCTDGFCVLTVAPTPAPTTAPTPAPTTSPTPAPTFSPEPGTPLIPLIILSSPSRHSFCSDVVVDATQTTGSGDKPFRSIVWTLQEDLSADVPSDYSNALLKQYLLTQSSLQLSIPAALHLLTPGLTYTISLAAKNVFNVERSSSIDIDITYSNIPYVKILSPDLHTTHDTPISISVEAAYPTECDVCDDKKCTSVEDDCCAPTVGGVAEDATCSSDLHAVALSGSCMGYPSGKYTCCTDTDEPTEWTSMTFSWTLQGPIAMGYGIILESSNRFLSIPAYFLASNTNYTAAVVVTAVGTEPGAHVASSRMATESVFISVASAPIAALITGGSVSTSVLNALTLDASTSYDPDDADASHLDFTWSATCASPDCTETHGSLLRKQANNATLYIPAFSLPPGTTTEFNVVVLNLVNLKVSTATTVVTMFAEVPPADSLPFPAVNALTPAGSVIASPNHPLTSTVSVADPTLQLPLTYSWSASSSAYFVGSTAFSSAAVNLNALTEAPSHNYVFTVSVTDALGRSSSSSVQLQKNAPPSLGALSITPPHDGVALVTNFEMLATSFSDPDLPLAYAFFGVSLDGVRTPLNPSSYSNSLHTVLQDGDLLLGVEVSDSYGSSTWAEAQVTVAANLDPSAVTSAMKDLIVDGESSGDGAKMARVVQIGLDAGGKCSVDWMIDKLGTALNYISADSSGLELIASSLGSVTSSALTGEEADKGYELMSTLVSEIDQGDADSASAILLSVSNLVAVNTSTSFGLSELDGVIGKVWKKIVEADRLVVGMSSQVLETENVQVTCGSFSSDGVYSGVNVSSDSSWFEVASPDDNSQQAFSAAIVKLPNAAMRNNNGENTTLISDGIMLSLSADDIDKGVNLTAGVTFSIPLLSMEGKRANKTADWYHCAVETTAGDWDSDSCNVLDVGANSITCHCNTFSRAASGGRRSLEGNATDGEDGKVADGSLVSDIGDAFFRAGAILGSPIALGDFREQLAILMVLLGIYSFYAVTVLNALYKDRKNVADRHQVLAKGEFVQKAIRAMRENFLRLELANKDDVIDPDGVREERASTSWSHQDTEVNSNGGLDAFTTRRLSPQMRMVNEKFLTRGSSAKSFDEVGDDGDILSFLSTSERPSLDKSKSGKISSFDFDRDSVAAATEVSGETEVTEETEETEEGSLGFLLHKAETMANNEQNERLKRFRGDRMGQFWKGIKKEHELFVVFGTRKSSIVSTATGKGAMFKGESIKQLTVSSESRSSGDSPAFGGSQGGGLDDSLADLEEYVNIAHRSTVLLCQFLSFLAMAIFFFEADESLLSGERWDEIGRASTGRAMYLFSENLLEGFVQVILTFPVTWLLMTLFKQLDEAGTAKILFETRVATDQAKLLHGISQDNPVDLRRSIHEVEGLLRIVTTTTHKQKKEDIMVVKYTLGLLKMQLKDTRRKQQEEDNAMLKRKVAEERKAGAWFGVARNEHFAELKRREEVEDVLVKMCSLDPVRQALFLKDRRAMNHMGGWLKNFKRLMYRIWVAEKEGYVPDEVSVVKNLACRLIALFYIAFLTLYLYKHALVEGQISTLWAVASFSTELAISFFLVSPVFIFVKFAIIPSVVASLVEGDVKSAQADYREKVSLKRQKAGLGLGGGRSVAGRMGRAMSRASKRMSRAISIGGGAEEGRESRGGSMGSFLGDEMEGGVEMEVLNPLAGAGAGVRDSGGGELGYNTHYDEDGNPYFEDLNSGATSYESPAGWDEDRDSDVWQKHVDEQSEGVFFVNGRTKRTTWSDRKAGGEGLDVGKEGEMVEVADGGGWGAVREAVVGEEGRAGWDAVFDAASGYNYYVNRETRAATWTEPAEDSKEK